MENKLTIQELLYSRGLENIPNIKLVRHTTKEFDTSDDQPINREAFIEYQKSQSKNRFKDCKYIISFTATYGTTARFIGVWEVKGYVEIKKYINGSEEISYLYDLEEVKKFEGIKERIIINWGGSTVGWHQWIENIKEVVEIQKTAEMQKNFKIKEFTDYLDFTLNFTDLTEMVKDKESYKTWHTVLSAVAGIYLILDKSTGNKYVGSAYGTEGILGRWKTYVNTNGSGGNLQLDSLIKQDSSYAKNFQFTILQTLSKTITPHETIKKEINWKNKLGTQAFGLNSN